MTAVALTADAVVELTELLEFVHDWIDHTPNAMATSLAGFTGSAGYDLDELRGDLARFAFLLGGDGQRLFRTTQ